MVNVDDDYKMSYFISIVNSFIDYKKGNLSDNEVKQQITLFRKLGWELVSDKK